MAPLSYAVYRPAPPRPEVPERRWWRTVGGWFNAASWVGLVAVGGFLAFVIVTQGTAADRRAIEEKEAARVRAVEEEEVVRETMHLRRVTAWLQNSPAQGPTPDSSGRPVPTSDRAKRMWVVNRMLVDGAVWRQGILERHGVGGANPLEAMDPAALARYAVDARRYPKLGAYVNDRAAAVAEIQRSYDAWTEEYVATLAQEAGLPVEEVRLLLPQGMIGVTSEEVWESNALLNRHRHLIRIDPRAHHAGGRKMGFERREDLRRLHELQAEVNEATVASKRARGSTKSIPLTGFGS